MLIIITTRPGKFWFGFALAAALVGPVRRVSGLVTAVVHTNCTGQEGYDSLVTSVRDRQMFLRDRFTTLRDEIVATHRERDVVDLAEALQQGKPLSPPSDAEFDLLLPSERAAALPAYFLALRTELVVIEGDGLQARKAGRLAEWLHGPMPKVAAEAAAASLSAFFGCRMVGRHSATTQADPSAWKMLKCEQ